MSGISPGPRLVRTLVSQKRLLRLALLRYQGTSCSRLFSSVVWGIRMSLNLGRSSSLSMHRQLPGVRSRVAAVLMNK